MTQEIGLREVFEQVNARLTTMEARIENLQRSMEARLDNLERRLDSLAEGLDATRRDMIGIHREISTTFRWTVGILLGTLFPAWVTIILAIVYRG